MRATAFIIFFSLFFAVYGLVNYYIFVRGWQVIPSGSPWRRPYLVLFFILAFSYLAGRLLERVWLSWASDVLVWMGSFWLAAMVYFLLIAVAFDALRLLNHLVPLYPVWIRQNYEVAKQVLALSTVGLVTLILVAGYVNALSPRVRHLSFHIPKKVDGIRSLTVTVASDLHLGTIVGRRRVGQIVDTINGLNADLVLFPGDVVDEDLGPVFRENLGDSLKSIRSKHGVFSITGNHEYIGGVEAACKYLAEHGITVLRDHVVRVDGGVYLVGREDRSISQFGGNKRKPLDELLAGIDKSYPVILLDHQPFRLSEGASLGADVQLSGHTHHGQLWPFNHITRAVYEVSCGYLQKGQTHVYVSSGLGTWGPPVRIGNRPEIVHLTLSFE